MSMNLSLLFSRHYAAAVFAVGALTVAASPLMAQQGTANGEVRRIDHTASKITIKHDKIDALELPAMTLVYIINEKLLVGLAPGDMVKFTAERRAGDYIVIDISKK